MASMENGVLGRNADGNAHIDIRGCTLRKSVSFFIGRPSSGDAVPIGKGEIAAAIEMIVV